MTRVPVKASLPIALAVATGHEARLVQRGLLGATVTDNRRTEFEVVRVGVGCCALDAERIVSAYSAIISTGFAGALESGINSGSLLLPNHIKKTGTTAYAVDPALQQMIAMNVRAAIVAGPLFHTDLLMATAKEKQRARLDTQCIACDMESALLAEVGQQGNRPFGCLRIILDPAETAIPDPIVGFADSSTQSEPSVTAFLTAVLRQPGQLPATAAFLWHTFKASRALSRSVIQLIEGRGS